MNNFTVNNNLNITIKLNIVPDKLLSGFNKALQNASITPKEPQKYYYFKDTLGDACNAIKAYSENKYPEIKQDGYLFTYGVLQALFLQISAINYFEEVFVADKSIFANLRKKAKKVIKTYKDVFANIDQKNHKCFVVFTQMDLNKDELDGYKNCEEQLPTKFTISIQESVQRATSYAIAVMEYIVNINKKVDIEKQPSKDLGSVINRFNDFDRIEGYLVTNHPLSESYYKDIKQWVSDCKAVFESIEDDLDNMDSYALFSRIFGKMPAIYEALEERFPSNVEESCQQYRGNHIDLLFYRIKELNALCKKYYELQLEQ
jgi:hypothetical protein